LANPHSILPLLRRAAATSGTFETRNPALLHVTGKDRLDLLHRLSTNDLLALPPGGAAETVFTTDKGRIIDLVLVLTLDTELILACSPGRAATIKAWIERYTIMEDVHVSVAPAGLHAFTVTGPDAGPALAAAAGQEVSPGSCMSSRAGAPLLLTASCRVGSGLRGLVLADESVVAGVRSKLAGAGVLWEEGDAELARIAAGLPAPEHELGDAFSPYDAGLRHAVSFTKGCYIGQEVIARLDTYQKVRRGLAGIIGHGSVEEAAIPFHVFDRHGDAGTITSLQLAGTGFIALGIIRTGADPDLRLSPESPASLHTVQLPMTAAALAHLERP
jgi:tRNA-modifying protein YgfZ